MRDAIQQIILHRCSSLVIRILALTKLAGHGDGCQMLAGAIVVKLAWRQALCDRRVAIDLTGWIGRQKYQGVLVDAHLAGNALKRLNMVRRALMRSRENRTLLIVQVIFVIQAQGKKGNRLHGLSAGTHISDMFRIADIKGHGAGFANHAHMPAMDIFQQRAAVFLNQHRIITHIHVNPLLT